MNRYNQILNAIVMGLVLTKAITSYASFSICKKSTGVNYNYVSFEQQW